MGEHPAATSFAYSTRTLPPEAQRAGWSDIVTRSYFPLDLDYRARARFDGTLKGWSLGAVEASRLTSDPAMYRRTRAHLKGVEEEEFLLTVPRAAPVRFLQMGRELVCPPGGFILERGNEPYEFSYGAANDMIVAKIGHAALARRLPDPGRFCAIRFDARAGIGALLVDFLQTTEVQAGALASRVQGAVGQQVVDLLALAIEADPSAALGSETSVRRAHLARIERETEARHADPYLTPGAVAAACGISTRYLHDLCQRDGRTWRDRLREIRLREARRLLARPGPSITEIAYGCGFSDASAFSRAYRARFGETPRETRASGR